MSAAARWAAIRRGATFLLGAFVIIEAALSPDDPIAEYVIGTVLVGLMPVDELVAGALARRRSGGCRYPSEGTTPGRYPSEEP